MSALNKKLDLSHQLHNASGQTFIEFMFLFLVVLFLSYGMIKGLDKGIGGQWEKLIKKIAAPTSDPIKLR
ncbi:MAG: hypothetical protein A2X86_04940 [Bdellovibrionales bacterium GWA2_49_15]|nr:MAG: hypothetical protein A2X86_04940 [Bdellovibrionales bacterium GWA2_49_15]